jgi:hypothetical protein
VLSSEIIGTTLVYQAVGEAEGSHPFGITEAALQSGFNILRVPGVQELIEDAARALELIPEDELEEFAEKRKR